MSRPSLSNTNSFKQLEKHNLKKLNAQILDQNLIDFWQKVNDIQDNIDLSDGDHKSSV